MINELKSFFSKKNIKKNIKSTLITLLGTFILAIGDGIFLIPFNIVSGGISGLSILSSSGGLLDVDTWSYIFMWGFFIVGIIFLGFKFCLNTLISTIFFPLFLTILLRTNIATGILEMLITDGMSLVTTSSTILVTGLEALDIGRLLLIGLIGGAICGLGCGITYRSGGSTGGVDILCFIMNKYFNISTATSSLVTDGLIVLAGLVIAVFNGVAYRFQFMSGLVGICAAFACSMLIEICYSGRSEVYIADVISEKYADINKFVINNLDRTTTSFKVNGGFKNNEHQMLRICFNRREYMKVKDGIAKIDPNAFIMFYNCETIEGLGFSKLEASSDNTITEFQKQIHMSRTKKQMKKISKENCVLVSKPDNNDKIDKDGK